MIIALIDETKRITEEQLHDMAAGMQIAAINLADAWSLNISRISVAVLTAQGFAEIFQPGGNDLPIVFTDSTSELNFLADHSWDDRLKNATCRVFCGAFADGGGGVKIEPCFTAATHELEALVNPQVNRWMEHPRAPASMVALEVCDPVQSDTYNVGGLPASNFVTPFWFDPVPHRHIVKYDHMQLCDHAGEIRGGGYVIAKEDGRTRSIWGAGLPKMEHPQGRTRRILGKETI